MKRFKWFVLGIVFNACVVVALSMFSFISDEEFSAFVSTFNLIGSMGTILAVGFAYDTYKSWYRTVRIQRIDKCMDAITDRLDFIIEAQTKVKHNQEDFASYYNDVALMDHVKAAKIHGYIGLTQIEKLQDFDVMGSRLLIYSSNKNDEGVLHQINLEIFNAEVKRVIGFSFNLLDDLGKLITEFAGPSGRL